MYIKFTYPVKTSMVLGEPWPLTTGDIKLEWRQENGRITALIVSVPPGESALLPTMAPSNTLGVAANVNFGWTQRETEVEEAVRTLRGLLSLFAYIEIDIEGVETEWVPETEEERKRIGVNSFSRKAERADLLEPRRLPYDLVVRTMASVKVGSHYEIPLGFLRKGTRAIYEGDYIAAFYNLFFFLETQYAPGYSNPRKVTEKLQREPVVLRAVGAARQPFSGERNVNDTRRKQLLALTDEKIIEHLVSVRGNLHHHSLRKPGVWHPEKDDEFKEEAFLLQHVVHSIAMGQVLALMYSADRNKDLMRSAQDAGAITKVRIEATGIFRGQRTPLQPYVINVPSRKVDRDTLDTVHQTFRAQFRGGPKDVELLEYKLLSEDGSQVYAVWERVPDQSPSP